MIKNTSFNNYFQSCNLFYWLSGIIAFVFWKLTEYSSLLIFYDYVVVGTVWKWYFVWIDTVWYQNLALSKALVSHPHVGGNLETLSGPSQQCLPMASLLSLEEAEKTKSSCLIIGCYERMRTAGSSDHQIKTDGSLDTRSDQSHRLARRSFIDTESVCWRLSGRSIQIYQIIYRCGSLGHMTEYGYWEGQRLLPSALSTAASNDLKSQDSWIMDCVEEIMIIMLLY